MITLELIKALAILGPIATLLVLGLTLTLRSGVASPVNHPGLRQLAGNLSQTVLLLAVCLVGLIALQQLVGFHAGLIR